MLYNIVPLDKEEENTYPGYVVGVKIRIILIRPRYFQNDERGKFFSNMVVQDYNSLLSHIHQYIQEQSGQVQGDPEQDSEQALSNTAGHAYSRNRGLK